MNKHLQDPNDDGVNWNEVEDKIWEECCKRDAENGVEDYEDFSEDSLDEKTRRISTESDYISNGDMYIRILCQNTLCQ